MRRAWIYSSIAIGVWLVPQSEIKPPILNISLHLWAPETTSCNFENTESDGSTVSNKVLLSTKGFHEILCENSLFPPWKPEPGEEPIHRIHIYEHMMSITRSYFNTRHEPGSQNTLNIIIAIVFIGNTLPFVLYISASTWLGGFSEAIREVAHL